MNYAVGDWGDEVYIRINKDVRAAYSNAVDGLNFSYTLAMPDYDVQISKDDQTFYTKNDLTDHIQAGTILKLTRTLGDTIVVESPIIFPE